MQNTNSKIKPSNNILVLGGTGKTGRRIVSRLQNRGIPTKIGSRSSSTPFDWNDQSNWKAALENVEAIYVSFSPDLAVPGASDAIRSLCNQAAESGIRKLVLLSGRGEEEAQVCENIVRESGLDWTILRCSWFNQNFNESFLLGPILSGTVALPVGDIGEPFIDAEDIADAAVAALTEGGHNGQLYELTGPRLITFAEAIKTIAEAACRDIQYIEIPHEAFIAELKSENIPEDYIALIGYLFTTVLDGRNAYLTDGVQRALGRNPLDFNTYANRTADEGNWNVNLSPVEA